MHLVFQSFIFRNSGEVEITPDFQQGAAWMPISTSGLCQFARSKDLHYMEDDRMD